MIQFDDVIAPFSRKEFLSETWNKTFLRLPGPAGRFTPLLTWDELSRVIEQHRLAPPRFRLFDGQNRRAMDPSRYMVPGIGGVPRVDSGKLVAALSQGATLIMDCVEEVAPKVGALSLDFQEVLGAGNYVGLYAVWPSPHGLEIHWDAEDLFVLQLSGRKRWQVYRPTRDYPLQDDLEAPPMPTGAPFWEGVLEDGEAMYIPRGWWHQAYPSEVPSLHLTIGTVPPHGMDLLQWTMRRLRRHAEIRKDIPLLDDAAGQKAMLKKLRALVSEALTDTLIADFRREWEADFRARPHVALPLAPAAQTQPITMETRVRLASSNRLLITRPPDSQLANFRARETLFACPLPLVPALEMLSDGVAVPLSELCAKLPNDAAIANLKASLASLALSGVVLLERD